MDSDLMKCQEEVVKNNKINFGKMDGMRIYPLCKNILYFLGMKNLKM